MAGEDSYIQQEIQDWLVSHGIDVHALKRELLQLVRISNSKPRYVIDEVAKPAGHKVLRLQLRTKSNRAMLVTGEGTHKRTQH